MRVDQDPAKLERESALVQEAQSIIETVIQRARDAGATAVADLDGAVAQQQTLEQLWEQDKLHILRRTVRPCSALSPSVAPT